MTVSPMRLRDFALEARVRRAEASAYSAAELAAARRQGFAEGEARGRAAAEAVAAEAAAEQRAETQRLIGEVATLRREADALLADALGGLEQAFRAALTAIAPGLAEREAIRSCAAALRQAGEAVRLPAVAVRAHPETVTALQAVTPPLPETLRLQPDPALADGVVRLAWDEGGGGIAPDAAIAAVEGVLDQVLTSGPECGGRADPVASIGSETDDRRN